MIAEILGIVAGAGTVASVIGVVYVVHVVKTMTWELTNSEIDKAKLQQSFDELDDARMVLESETVHLRDALKAAERHREQLLQAITKTGNVAQVAAAINKELMALAGRKS